MRAKTQLWMHRFRKEKERKKRKNNLSDGNREKKLEWKYMHMKNRRNEPRTNEWAQRSASVWAS